MRRSEISTDAQLDGARSIGVEELYIGIPVWVPTTAGWMPASVNALDENESHPASGGIQRTPERITVEIHLGQDRSRQYQKVDVTLLRRRDPALRGNDRPI